MTKGLKGEREDYLGRRHVGNEKKHDGGEWEVVTWAERKVRSKRKKYRMFERNRRDEVELISEWAGEG